MAAGPYHGDVPADCFRHEALGVVFQVREKRLAVLLWQRATAPFAGAWALPGGLLEAGERLGAAAGRHLAAKVDIPEIAHLEHDREHLMPETLAYALAGRDARLLYGLTCLHPRHDSVFPSFRL